MHPLIRVIHRTLTTACAWLLAAGFAHGADLTLFAAASLSDAVREIAGAYETATGDRVRLNFGSSSLLARQIVEGAPADVFFSADEATMDRIEKLGLIAPETRRRPLSNTLVVVIPSDARWSPRTLQELTGPALHRLALADPKTVPAGIYARAWLEKAGYWRALESRVVPTDNVRAALAAVAAANAEAGIVYKTDAATSSRVQVAFAAPLENRPVIRYSVAVLRGSKAPEASLRLLETLTASAARRVFKRLGFIIVE